MYSKLLTMFGRKVILEKDYESELLPMCRRSPRLCWVIQKIEKLVMPEVKKPKEVDVWNMVKIGQLCMIMLSAMLALILIMYLYKRWRNHRIIAQFLKDGKLTQDVMDISSHMFEKELLLQNRGFQRSASNDSFKSALDTEHSDSDSLNDIATPGLEIDETDDSDLDPEPIKKHIEPPKRMKSAIPVPKKQICTFKFTSSAHESASTSNVSTMTPNSTLKICYKDNDKQPRSTLVQVSQKRVWRI